MDARSAGLGARGGHAVFVKSDVTRMVVADTTPQQGPFRPPLSPFQFILSPSARPWLVPSFEVRCLNSVPKIILTHCKVLFPIAYCSDGGGFG
jgi:hypothetical protein